MAPLTMDHGNLPHGASLQPDARQVYSARLRMRQHRAEALRLKGDLAQQQTSPTSNASKRKPTRRTTTTRTKRRERTDEVTNGPCFFDNLPLEIRWNILRFLHVREDGMPLFLRPQRSRDPTYNSHRSIDTPVVMRATLYNDNNFQQPPMEKHFSPATDLLLVNKFFRDEGYKQFYHENVFSFSDDNHVDDVLRRLDLNKERLIHHVAFESQWVLKIRLNPNMSGKIVSVFDVDWGNYITSALNILPNITSVTLRVRCTTRYMDFILCYGPFEWDQNTGKIHVVREKQVIAFPDTRDEMRAWVANKVEAEYTALGMARYLLMIKLTFQYGNEDREWTGRERVWSLTDIERDPTQFGLTRGKKE